MDFNWRHLVAIVGIAAVALMALAKLYFVPTQPVSGPNFALSKPSNLGIYLVAIEPETTPVRQGELHSWIVTVKTPDGKPVEDARITVSGGMPAHGHGLPTSPEATGHLGEGRYRVEGVKFNMGGQWELKLAISALQGDDQAVFNLMI